MVTTVLYCSIHVRNCLAPAGLELSVLRKDTTTGPQARRRFHCAPAAEADIHCLALDSAERRPARPFAETFIPTHNITTNTTTNTLTHLLLTVCNSLLYTVYPYTVYLNAYANTNKPTAPPCSLEHRDSAVRHYGLSTASA